LKLKGRRRKEIGGKRQPGLAGVGDSTGATDTAASLVLGHGPWPVAWRHSSPQ